MLGARAVSLHVLHVVVWVFASSTMYSFDYCVFVCVDTFRGHINPPFYVGMKE